MNLNRKEMIGVAISIIIVMLFFMSGTIYEWIMNQTNTASVGNQDVIQNLSNSVAPVIQDVVVGKGAEALNGKKLTVWYTGYLSDGKKFDASDDHGGPFEFVLGAGQVIQGWEIGLKGMKVGGRRTILIPPSFGYGDKDWNGIPANSTLIFDVQLLKAE